MTVFDDLAARVHRVHGAVVLVRGRAVSPGGGVTAEVDATGRLTALTITDDALAGGSAALAALVTATHRAACAEADAAAQALRDELTDDPRFARIVAAADAPTAPRAPDAHEESYRDRPILYRP